MLTRNNGGKFSVTKLLHDGIGGEKMNKISDYQSTSGDAIGLAKIGTQPFTIVKVQDSSYEGEPSVRIMTQKPIKVEGTEYSEFYTSRKAVMDTLSNPQLRQDLQNQPVGPVKCQLTKAKGGGKDYWILVDA